MRKLTGRIARKKPVRNAPAAAPVSSLARLNQIACDLERAIANENWELVTQAASLLAPVLESVQREALGVVGARFIAPSCRNAGANGNAGVINHAPTTPNAQRLTLDAAQARLAECERKLTEAMARTGDELRGLRKGRRCLSAFGAKASRDTAARQLDTQR